jgi:hypothetical protein
MLGALRATGRRGLQPAMDHILENEGKPVPTDGGSSNEAARPSAGGDDGDEDEDMKLAMSLSQGGSDEQDAKVCARYRRWIFELMSTSSNVVHQVLGMWQGV